MNERGAGYFERTNGESVAEGESWLAGIYGDFNASRFKNELPAPIIKISELSINMARFALVDGVPQLFFSPYFSFKSNRMHQTMLHLMCHYFDPTHGATFQGRVVEIMGPDAWLREEMDKAKVLAIHDDKRLAAFGIAERLAKNPTMTWMKARQQIARELKVTVRATHEFLPNFEAAWAAIKKRAEQGSGD